MLLFGLILSIIRILHCSRLDLAFWSMCTYMYMYYMHDTCTCYVLILLAPCKAFLSCIFRADFISLFHSMRWPTLYSSPCPRSQRSSISLLSSFQFHHFFVSISCPIQVLCTNMESIFHWVLFTVALPSVKVAVGNNIIFIPSLLYWCDVHAIVSELSSLCFHLHAYANVVEGVEVSLSVMAFRVILH